MALTSMAQGPNMRALRDEFFELMRRKTGEAFTLPPGYGKNPPSISATQLKLQQEMMERQLAEKMEALQRMHVAKASTSEHLVALGLLGEAVERMGAAKLSHAAMIEAMEHTITRLRGERDTGTLQGMGRDDMMDALKYAAKASPPPMKMPSKMFPTWSGD